MGACPDALYSHLLSDLLPVIQDGSPRAFASQVLLDSILKKYEASGPLSDANALDKFYASNSRCKEFTSTNPETWADEQVDSSVTHRLHQHFAISFPADLDMYGFGPGASAEVKGSSFYHKVSNLPTCTSRDIYRFYLDIIRRSPPSLACERERRESQPAFKQVKGNKLCFVPKNVDSSRVIAVEPSLNMYLQKGVGRALESCLKRAYRIDITDQQFRNRDLARQGSYDLSYSTIDLKSASDSVSLRLCEKILPPILFETLSLIRSGSSTVNDTTVVVNHMISSMGNATTFPLQTIVFSTILLSVYDVLGIPIIYNTQKRHGNFGVFGDDIICRTEAYPYLIRTLRRYGFEINEKKSFTGFNPFRESCGGDYYKGRNVRPVYCYSLQNSTDVYSLINRLIIWSARHLIDISGTLRYLASFVKCWFVPLYEDVSSGIRMPLPTDTEKASIPNTLYKYKCLRPIPARFEVGSNKKDYKKLRASFNQAALYLSFLQGSIRNNVLTYRIDGVRCAKRSIVTPVWDYIDRSSSLLEDLSNEVYSYTMASYEYIFRA